MQYNMKKLDQRFKVSFIYHDDDMSATIEAPLPATYGMSVGSEFTSPFDANTLAGLLQKFKIPMAGGVSKRVGVVTTKFFSNPEPTEISFDVEFHAEVSAREEVVEPVLALMNMSLGRNIGNAEIAQTIGKIKGFGGKIVDLLGLDEETSEAVGGVFGDLDNPDSTAYSDKTEGALAFIGIIRGPSTVAIRFGNLYTLDGVWISSVNAQFSNVIDSEGFPLSATCSVTCVLQRDPVAGDLLRFFGAQ